MLIWFSGKEEKHLKLNHVSRIMPGQRTVCPHALTSFFSSSKIIHKEILWIISLKVLENPALRGILSYLIIFMIAFLFVFSFFDSE